MSWSRRGSNPRPSRCGRDALPLGDGPEMPLTGFEPATSRSVARRSIQLSCKGVHPPMRRHASPHGRGWETDHGAGMVPDEAEEGTRLACHRSRARRVYGVACGRRSRHEPLRAPGRTRSGDLPLTRRTLCLLSYRGECRKTPGRPATTLTRPPHGTGRRGMPSSGPVWRAVSAARACAGPPSGSRRDGSAASRAMEESNLRLRFWRPSGCRCPDGAFIVSALRFSTMPCRPCPRRHGMVCVPGRQADGTRSAGRVVSGGFAPPTYPIGSGRSAGLGYETDRNPVVS